MDNKKTVLQKILSKGREAILGGVPILYIKTDSDTIINKLVYNDVSPWVMPVTGAGEGEENSNRPLFELKASGKAPKDTPLNVKNSVPTSYSSIKYPHIWVNKIAEKPSARFWQDIEKYVVDRENPDYRTYKFLQNSIVLLYSSEVYITPALRPYTEFIDVDLPEYEEIKETILRISNHDENLEKRPDQLNELCARFQGFTLDEIEMTMHRIMALTTFENANEVEAIVLDRKKQKMEGGVLDLVQANGSIGGMIGFRSWLDKQIKPLKSADTFKRKTGTLPPKGVLLCGIPGCGKSEAAKFTAQSLNLPLLKMDIGSLMDKYVGNSEQNMREALQLAEAMSPCVLWIDELEKGFSDAGGSGGDDSSGSFKRMFGYMLGWMQDNTKPCFIFATANNIGGLPKEFFRSGRFDALYAVYLPTAKECASIFATSARRALTTMARAQKADESDIDFFAKECFSESLYLDIVNTCLVRNGKPRIVIGADIQKIVNMTLRTLSDRNTISAGEWKQAIEKTLTFNENGSNDCVVYGDGQENIDSIAVGYCRMLRKNFTPTGDKVLFSSADYDASNLNKFAKLLAMPTEGMTPEELKEHNRKLKENSILKDRGAEQFVDAYDKAVYKLLLQRINDMAILVEKRESDLLIK